MKKAEWIKTREFLKVLCRLGLIHNFECEARGNDDEFEYVDLTIFMGRLR